MLNHDIEGEKKRSCMIKDGIERATKTISMRNFISTNEKFPQPTHEKKKISIHVFL